MVTNEAPNTGHGDFSVLTVCVDQASAELVRQAAIHERGNLAAELSDYSPGDAKLQCLLKLPSTEMWVCVIDFDQDHERAVAAAASLQKLLQGRTSLLALSEKTEPALILEAMRAGCSEYLAKPLSLEALCDALIRLRGRVRPADLAHTTRGKTLAFLGCRGGAGTTTLAVHLAMYLCRPLGRRAILVDQHRCLGHVGLYLGLDGAGYDFYELVRSVKRLDRTLLSGFVAHHASGLDVLPSSNFLTEMPDIPLDAWERAVRFLAEVYEYVVLDSPHGAGDLNLVTADCCDELYLIATPDVPALRDLSRFVDRLQQSPVPAAKIHVVINRFSSQGAVSVKQIESAIQQPISFTIPNHCEDLRRAMNTGTPIAADQKSEFVTQMKKWAGSLLPAAEVPHEQPKRRFSLWS